MVCNLWSVMCYGYKIRTNVRMINLMCYIEILSLSNYMYGILTTLFSFLKNVRSFVCLLVFIFERQKGKRRIRSRLCADSREPDAGLRRTNCEIMTWAEVGRFTNWATQAPRKCLFILRDREESMWTWANRGGTERERESLKQALCCQQRARRGAWSHKPWDRDLSQNRVRCLTNSPTQVPPDLFAEVHSMLSWKRSSEYKKEIN